jgi:hypothetical protein
MLADEEIDMDRDQVSAEVERYGKIVVTVVRGDYVPSPFRSVPRFAGIDHNTLDTVVSSAAVVKKNNVSHVVKLVIWPQVQGPVADNVLDTSL